MAELYRSQSRDISPLLQGARHVAPPDAVPVSGQGGQASRRESSGHFTITPYMIIYTGIIKNHAYLNGRCLGPGQGCLFLLCPKVVEVNGRLKMGYMNGAFDSKAWCAITYFQATGERPL